MKMNAKYHYWTATNCWVLNQWLLDSNTTTEEILGIQHRKLVPMRVGGLNTSGTKAGNEE
jgi:hypothetical protein